MENLERTDWRIFSLFQLYFPLEFSNKWKDHTGINILKTGENTIREEQFLKKSWIDIDFKLTPRTNSPHTPVADIQWDATECKEKHTELWSRN